MALTGLAPVLMVPNLVALAGLAMLVLVLVLVLQLQVRVVEEPYLRREHGCLYEDTPAGPDASCQAWVGLQFHPNTDMMRTR